MAKSNTRRKKKAAVVESKRELIILQNCRGSFLCINEPNTQGEYANDKYQGDFLIPKGKEKSSGLSELKRIAVKVAQEYFDDDSIEDFDDIPGKHSCVKCGDERFDNCPEGKEDTYKHYQDHWYITPKSDFKPPMMKGDGKTEYSNEERENWKSGDFFNIVVSVYGYSQSGGGIGLGLQMLQPSKSGPALGGAGKAAAMKMLSPIEVELGEIELDEEEDEEETPRSRKKPKKTVAKKKRRVVEEEDDEEDDEDYDDD